MRKHSIREEVRKRIFILDGGLGTLIQGYGLTEEDFRGDEFASWPVPLKGCNDLLVLTRPDVIGEIHRRYLEAGADIITTDTFSATSIALADYGLQDYAYEISRAGTRVARKAADEFTRIDPRKPRYVAGSVGPTNRTSSIAADINNTALRDITFDELASAYAVQIEGLVDGGADIIQLETFFDTLNAKAAIFAAETVFAKKGVRLPLIVSGTLTNSGRTLSGQTVEAFYASVKHASPLAVGFNCSFGTKQLMPYLKRLSDVCGFAVSVYPNAGLPNLSGGYDETPRMMAADVEEYMRQGLINIVGGCCGTTPEHIAEIAAVAQKYRPRPTPHPEDKTVLSGLEPLTIDDNSNFINIGERTNVAGSAKFARLIREDRYEEALSLARQQIEGGATIIDICFDDGMIDGPAAMTRFLNMAAGEPEIARVPFMLDSSSWDTLEAGLRCVQGKSIVNSISLKEGEGEFLRRARLIRLYGAAAVVMLFDEKGQADTYERKIEVAARAYRLLTENSFPPEDIIFDPNVLAVATGMSEHDAYALDFIRAVGWIKENLPHTNISGGVSNLSFSFRGIDKVRRAMHSVFLCHAIKAGMNMGIVNPAMTIVYDEIEPELLELVTDVVLNRRPDAGERLAAYAERAKAQQAEDQKDMPSAKQWRSLPVAKRINYAMLKGISDYIEQDAAEAFEETKDPLAVIDGMFMPPMEKVGEMFGAGMMFLPQVVKTARVMKKGVNALTPFIEAGQETGNTKKEKIVIATVKGDVHDIGKNIVSVVMSCNGYRITDLGVMVEGDTIVDTAINEKAGAIALSGLITPSLEEMIKVLRELERRGETIPVFVGGATTSALHTAVKMAPEYSGPVIHSGDASENVTLLGRLFGPGREEFLKEIKEKQEKLREAYLSSASGTSLIPIAKARANGRNKRPEDIITPAKTGIEIFRNYPIAEVEKYIDWTYFLTSWDIKGKYPDVLDSPEKGEEAHRLIADAKNLLDKIKQERLLTLNGVTGVFPAVRRGDDIIISSEKGKEITLPQLRSQNPASGKNLSLADYIIPEADGHTDYIAAFTVSAGFGLEELTESFRRENDDYNAIMSKLLADRLTEAFAEAVHQEVRRRLWGFEKGLELPVEDILNEKYRGLRMAFGYPAAPDHSLKKEIFDLLSIGKNTGLYLGENYMIEPAEALCGLIFADSDIHYFDVGRIGEDQLEDYARRRRISTEEARRLLPRNV